MNNRKMKDERMREIKINGKWYTRSKLYLLESSGHCHDCGAKHGELHFTGCEVERCPRCEGQLNICLCEHNYHHRKIREKETGEED